MSGPVATQDIPRFCCVHYLEECRQEQGGVVQAVLDLCGALAERGHDVTLLTLDAQDAPAQWTGHPSAPRVVELGRAHWGAGLLNRNALRRALHLVRDADLVHLHTPWALGNRQLARRLRSDRIPYLVTIHGMLDDWSMAQKRAKKRLYLALGGRRFLRAAARLHFTAEAERAQALRWIQSAADRCAVAPLVVDLSSFDELPGPELARRVFPAAAAEAPKILFLSRLHPKKGVELLLEAAGLLLRQGIPFELLIAGPGEAAYRSKLQAAAQRQGLGDHAHFLGMVRGVEKQSLYQAAELLVLPTHQENFGLVLVEALACGTPVVTTRGTDIWCELERAGALVVERTAVALSQAMRGLLSDPASAIGRGEQGRRFVTEWLERGRVVRAYEQLYTQALADGKPIGQRGH